MTKYRNRIMIAFAAVVMSLAMMPMITVNVFATTNPKNSLHIAKRVFKAASRANVSHFYVFQQNKNKATDRWYFEESGHKIY